MKRNSIYIEDIFNPSQLAMIVARINADLSAQIITNETGYMIIRYLMDQGLSDRMIAVIILPLVDNLIHQYKKYTFPKEVRIPELSPEELFQYTAGIDLKEVIAKYKYADTAYGIIKI